LIYWSFWERTLKNLIREIALPIFLSLFIGLFWFFKPFGTAPYNGLLALFLFSGSLYWYIKKREESLEFLVFLTTFLGLFALYNIQFAFSIPSFLAEILFFAFVFCCFIYLAFEKNKLQNGFLFAIGLSICLLQAFLALSFLPLNPLAKSFILTSLFYAFWFIVVKREDYLKYLILTVAVLILVLATARWPTI